ncbi:helix-turn-helix domain-containing protein [Bifidobacterium moukalabense]|uniref:helix-turn-helix domain-containing protein n=1 Tax=Bifidobacterium moukalabense TaxID=1333651 RepID=UPI0010F7C66C|nr:helix-turn-helix transcriptional regulator [Bifidobacterium moukalabense]
MDEQFSYDYGELAFDLYQAADGLLDDLVAMRKHRGMTQSQLADEMGVSQSYISQIENGQKQLVSLLTDYAQEVGARIRYVVEPAEKKPKGNRHYATGQVTSQTKAFVEWQNGDYSSEDASIQVKLPSHGDDAPRSIFVDSRSISIHDFASSQIPTMQMESAQ